MRILLILLWSLLSLPAFASCGGPSFMDRLTEAERAQLATTLADIPFAQGLSFTATKGDQVITLVGTIHIYDPRLTAIRTAITPAIQAADVLLVEASPDDAAALQDYITKTPEIMFMTDGPTLPDLLPEPAWQALADAARARQIPPFMAAKMQPWFLSLSLAIAPCAMADLAAGRQGLDFMLMDDATAADVPIQSLEHWSAVIDIMRAAPLEEQIAELSLGVLPSDLQQELFVAMLDNYVAGRPAEVWEASRLALNYVPGLDPAVGRALFEDTEKMLLVDRNLNWMPFITGAMTVADRAVVAVGAAHLPGEAGLLRLLELEGWTITARD